MRTLTISLTTRQAAMLQSAIDAGSYASNGEIVNDALRLREERQKLRAVELEHLKQAYEDGMASGEGREISPADLLSQLKRERSVRA